MKKFLLLTLIPTPALAHAGPHLHPHGLEIGIGAMLAALTIAAAAGAAIVIRVRK